MNIIKNIRLLNPFLHPLKRASLYKKELFSMGEHCEVFHKVSFGSEPYLISLGNNVKVTYGVKFITHDGGVYVLRNLNKLPNGHIYGKITIGNNVFIGNDSIILPGVKVGDNVIIGAGSVITKSIPANSIVAGCPGRIIENITTYYEKIKKYELLTSGMNFDEKKEYLNNLLLSNPKKFVRK